MSNQTIILNKTYYSDTAVLNVFLVAAVMFLLIYYVIISNMITASRYKVSLLNNELSALIETNGALTAQKLLIEDSSAIIDFVQKHNMTEARHIIHIFESSEVALRQ